MRFILVILSFFFICFSASISAQEKGYLEFSGKTVKNYKSLAGVQIKIFSGNTKIAEVSTGRNGRFMFDLELGIDYRIVFNSPGCVEMFAMIYSSACPSTKKIYPIYEIDVNFFELNQMNLNYEAFKQPFAKIVYDGNKRFIDEDNYVDNFIKGLYYKPEDIKTQDELVNTEEDKNKILSNKLKEEEERLLKEQQLLAEKNALEEAERMKKLLADKMKSTLVKSEKKENNIKDALERIKEDEVYLKIAFERKIITENQNKTIKKNVEANLLKSVAENERVLKSKSTDKNIKAESDNEVIAVLKREALAKVSAEDLRVSAKIKNKQLQIYEGIYQKELFGQLKIAVKNEKNYQATTKKHPVIGVTTNFEQYNFKSVYYIYVSEGNLKKNFRKEKFNWGLTYYYKNDKQINEYDYFNELKQYNVPL